MMNKMTRCRTILSLVVPLVLAASARAQAQDFDQGADARAVLRQARERAGQVEPALQAVRAANVRYNRDCVNFLFEPGGPAISERVTLVSRGYIEECRYVPGPDGRGGWRECWSRPGWTYREKVQVEIANRQPTLPWERELFAVCLEGPWLRLSQIAAAYDYQVGRSGGLYTLVPGRKIAMDPDPAGILTGRPVNTGTSLALDFTDRWASYYGPGEKTILHVEVWQAVAGWFDSKLAEADLTLEPAGTYRVDFSALGASLEPGKSYYAKWGFRRRGAISRDILIKRGETESVPFSPTRRLAS